MSVVEQAELVTNVSEKPATNYKQLAAELQKRITDLETINKKYTEHIDNLNKALQERDKVLFLFDNYIITLEQQFKALKFSIDLITNQGGEHNE